MRLVKSAFERFVEQLFEIMKEKTLLCNIDAVMSEVDRTVVGKIRQILVYRSGQLIIPKYPGYSDHKIAIIILTGWANSSLLITLFWGLGEKKDGNRDDYDAEIILNGKKVSPYDGEILRYISTFKLEHKKCNSDECHTE